MQARGKRGERPPQLPFKTAPRPARTDQRKRGRPPEKYALIEHTLVRVRVRVRVRP